MSLNELTVKNLIDIAKENGISGYSNLKKEDLIILIEENLNKREIKKEVSKDPRKNKKPTSFKIVYGILQHDYEKVNIYDYEPTVQEKLRDTWDEIFDDLVKLIRDRNFSVIADAEFNEDREIYFSIEEPLEDFLFPGCRYESLEDIPWTIDDLRQAMLDYNHYWIGLDVYHIIKLKAPF